MTFALQNYKTESELKFVKSGLAMCRLRLFRAFVFPLLLAAAIYFLVAQSARGMADHDPILLAFQAELHALQQEYGFPGATAAYVLSDGRKGTVATGLSDIESDTLMTPRDRMLAASVGKSFVGATVVALAQEGKLGLNDLASNWLSERDWFERLPNHETITVSNLLTHSSGLPDHVYADEFTAAFSENWAAPGNPFTPEYLISLVLDEPALFPAGTDWSYSDTGYLLLGMIIEEASEHSFYDEVVDRFLVPLRLGSTTPSNLRVIHGLAPGYMSADNKFGLPAKSTSSPGIMTWNPAQEWSGGGFASNSMDLAIWAKALYEGEAMDGAYLHLLMDAAPIGGEGSGVSYGAGVTIKESGPIGKNFGHAGGIPGYTSSMRYYPEHGLSVTFQINLDGGIADESSKVGDYMEEMESRLATVLVDAQSR